MNTGPSRNESQADKHTHIYLFLLTRKFILHPDMICIHPPMTLCCLRLWAWPFIISFSNRVHCLLLLNMSRHFQSQKISICPAIQLSPAAALSLSSCKPNTLKYSLTFLFHFTHLIFTQQFISLLLLPPPLSKTFAFVFLLTNLMEAFQSLYDLRTGFVTNGHPIFWDTLLSNFQITIVCNCCCCCW